MGAPRGRRADERRRAFFPRWSGVSRRSLLGVPRRSLCEVSRRSLRVVGRRSGKKVVGTVVGRRSVGVRPRASSRPRLAADPKPKPNSATATATMARRFGARSRSRVDRGLVAEAPGLRRLVDRIGVSGLGAGEPEAGSPGPAGSPKSTRPWDVEVRLEDGAHALRAYAETEAGRGEEKIASAMTVVASARATAAAFGFARDGTKKIVGAGRNRNPGVVPAPTVSSAFEGFEIALAPDSRSDRFGTGETTGKGASSKPPGGPLLRTLLRADRFGVSRAPTPPGVSEPPDAWAAADGGSSEPTATRGGDDAAAAAPGPVEIELVGATLDVSAEAAERRTRARAAARAFAAFFEGGNEGARRRKPQGEPYRARGKGRATTAQRRRRKLSGRRTRPREGGAFPSPRAPTLRREGRVVVVRGRLAGLRRRGGGGGARRRDAPGSRAGDRRKRRDEYFPRGSRRGNVSRRRATDRRTAAGRRSPADEYTRETTRSFGDRGRGRRASVVPGRAFRRGGDGRRGARVGHVRRRRGEEGGARRGEETNASARSRHALPRRALRGRRPRRVRRVHRGVVDDRFFGVFGRLRRRGAPPVRLGQRSPGGRRVARRVEPGGLPKEGGP